MIQSATLTRLIDGVQTDVLIQAFADRIIVLITQLGKVGSLIEATLPPTTPLLPPPPPDPSQPNEVPLPVPPAALHLTPLLGGAPSERLQTLHSLYASHVATLVWTLEEASVIEANRRAIIVGISLAKSPASSHPTEISAHDRTVFRGVMTMVRELLAKT